MYDSVPLICCVLFVFLLVNIDRFYSFLILSLKSYKVTTYLRPTSHKVYKTVALQQATLLFVYMRQYRHSRKNRKKVTGEATYTKIRFFDTVNPDALWRLKTFRVQSSACCTHAGSRCYPACAFE